MRNGNIFSIAAQLGWTASAQYKEGRLFFDFHRKTLSGVPFTFTAEMKDGKVSNLVKEIESFVDASLPRQTANPFWLVCPGASSGTEFRCPASPKAAFYSRGLSLNLRSLLGRPASL